MSVVVPDREKAGPLQAAVAQTKQHILQLALCMQCVLLLVMCRTSTAASLMVQAA